MILVPVMDRYFTNIVLGESPEVRYVNNFPVYLFPRCSVIATPLLFTHDFIIYEL
ncbi:hypothetical protein bcgnr5376_58020 [Bacillus cereus]